MAKKKSGIVKAAVGIGIQRKNRIVQILRSANIMQYVRRRLLK